MVSESPLSMVLPVPLMPGLLAGLYEFPSFSGVSKNSSQENLTAQILSKLQIDKSRLTRSETKSVGDVLHIFSHIRKTYRTRWILLESLTGPPPLVSFDSVENLASGGAKSKKAGLSPTKVEKVNTRWVSLKEVDDMKSVSFHLFLILSRFTMKYSMGTGVAKIWNLTKMLWM